MKNLLRSFCISVTTLVGLSDGYAQSVFIDPFQNLSELCGMNRDEILVNCPKMPLVYHFGKFDSEQHFIDSYKNWIRLNPDQYSYFKIRCEDLGHNIGWSTMGIEEAVERILPDSLRQGYPYFVYEALKMNYKRVNELAPHFPSYSSSGDYKKDSVSYEKRYIEWSRSYHSEVENIYNSPENRRLQGDAFELMELGMPADSLEATVNQVVENGEYPEKETENHPAFMYAKIGTERPLNIAQKDELQNKTVEEVYQVQKWLFLFEPETFNQWFGGQPTLPEAFDIDKFKADLVAGLEPDPNSGNYFFH